MENIKWIKPYANDKFSELKGIDLQDLIIKIEDTYLVYRDTLGLSKEMTFGIEIEFEKLPLDKVKKFFEKSGFEKDGWKTKTESRISPGGEINSPIMTDSKEYWETLKIICNYLRKGEAETFDSGGHIHVGAHTLGYGANNLINLLWLYATYEHVLYRFGYGDKLSARPLISTYAKHVRMDILATLKSKDIARGVNDDYSIFSSRSQGVNFCNVSRIGQEKFVKDNTVEFRFPNGTINNVIWQNNINTVTKLLMTASNSNLDIDFLKYRIGEQRITPSSYKEICLRDALDFVDIVFDNNLDKIYFLRQYFRNFESTFKVGDKAMARSFVKPN